MLGFPVALVLALVFDGTPEGIARDPASRDRKLVFGAAGLLAVLALG